MSDQYPTTQGGDKCDVKTCDKPATWIRKSKDIKGGIIRFCDAHGRAADMIGAIL